MKKVVFLSIIFLFGTCTEKKNRGSIVYQEYLGNNTIQLSISPSASVGVGDNISLAVGLKNVEDLFACSFEMVYDMEKIRLNGVVFDDSFGDSLQVSSFLSDNLSSSFIIGIINNEEVTGLSGSWNLVDIDFTAISSSSTNLELKNFLLFDNTGDTIQYIQEDDPVVEINILPQ